MSKAKRKNLGGGHMPGVNNLIFPPNEGKARRKRIKNKIAAMIKLLEAQIPA